MNSENLMRNLIVDKVTINISTSSKIEDVERANKLLEKITGQKPITVRAKKRVEQWGIRPGVPKGAKVTLRGKKAIEVLNRLLDAVERRVNPKSLDEYGNFGFGIKEYLNIPGIKYDPSIGILGMDVLVTVKRRGGFRVKERKLKRSKIPEKHKVKREEAKKWFEREFNMRFEEKEEKTWF